ncbi:MAG: hypothetical protein ACKVOO_08480 [Burkholderiaceae bacterium]
MSTATFSSASIFCKSEKGLDEMTSRKYGLPPKLRSILILIDGKRPFADLAKLASHFGTPEEMVSRLVDGGFVQPKGGSEKPSQFSNSTSPAPFEESERSMAAACRHAVRFLNDQMGPMAESLCMRMESCKTLDEFIVATARAQGVLASVRGKTIAERFASEVAARAPNQ